MAEREYLDLKDLLREFPADSDARRTLSRILENLGDLVGPAYWAPDSGYWAFEQAGTATRRPVYLGRSRVSVDTRHRHLLDQDLQDRLNDHPQYQTIHFLDGPDSRPARGWRGQLARSGATDDASAESGASDADEVDALAHQMRAGDYAVPDQLVTAKTRGSAQRVFAERVKQAYGWRCALTGIATRDFLVASHIVPWSEDESIRLDPTNGICLSTLVDRAFDTGYLSIHDNYMVRVNWELLGQDESLREALHPYDGQPLTLPAVSPPNPEFLRRRLEATDLTRGSHP